MELIIEKPKDMVKTSASLTMYDNTLEKISSLKLATCANPDKIKQLQRRSSYTDRCNHRRDVQTGKDKEG